MIAISYVAIRTLNWKIDSTLVFKFVSKKSVKTFSKISEYEGVA